MRRASPLCQGCHMPSNLRGYLILHSTVENYFQWKNNFTTFGVWFVGKENSFFIVLVWMVGNEDGKLYNLLLFLLLLHIYI